VRVAKENAEAIRQRKAAQAAYEEDKRRKLDRTRHGGVGASVNMVNLFSLLGLADEYLKDKEAAIKILPSRVEGRLRKLIPDEAYAYLVSDFGATTIKVDGYEVIHLEEDKGLSLFTEVAELSGQKQQVCKEVYAAILRTVKRTLRRERKVRLPDWLIIKVDYRKAKKERKGKSPFDGKPMIFKAKPASNKLKFRAVKKFKVFVDEKIRVEAPKK
jgi:nucleoid DNA-binding protein